MTVYVVQGGSLYNWSIYGIFSSREKAKQYVSQNAADNDDCAVEADEYELDKELPALSDTPQPSGGIDPACIPIIEANERLRTTISQQAETIGALREALQVLKVRIHFIGWPGESFWDCGEGVMLPDWRNEIAILEDALASSATEERSREA